MVEIIEPSFSITDLSIIIDKKQLLTTLSNQKPITNSLLKGLNQEGIVSPQKENILNPMLTYLTDNLHEQLYNLNKTFLKSIVWSVIRLFIQDKYYFDLDNHNETNSFGVIYPHNKTHLFDTDDCAKCQILTQSQNLQTPDNSIIYPGTSRLTSFLKFRNSAWKNNSLLRFSCQNF